MTEMGWQPIETAPKDGIVDLWVRQENSEKWRSMFSGLMGSQARMEYRLTDCRRVFGKWVRTEVGGNGEDYAREIESSDWTGTTAVTHWQPLPEGPK